MSGRWVTRASVAALGLGLLLGAEAVLAAETYGPVKSGESLWSVARKAVPGHNPAQVMKDLFARNPQAFVNGDMNKLKVGAVLSLDGTAPAPAQAAAATPSRPATAAATHTAPATPAAAPPKAAVAVPAAVAKAAAPAAPVTKAIAPSPAKPATPPVAAVAAPPPPPAGSTTAGEIIKLVGRASAATDEGDIRPLAQGNPVNSGETVVTAPASFVRMKLADGAYIVLRPSTRFQIAQFKYSESGEGDSSVFSLLKGGFRAVTGAIGKRNKNAVSYRTAVATIGIRGTDVEALDCTDGCPDIGMDVKPGMYLKTHAGTAFVRDRNAMKPPKDVPAGNSTVTTPDGDTKSISFDAKTNPLNADPTPTADPDKC